MDWIWRDSGTWCEITKESIKNFVKEKKRKGMEKSNGKAESVFQLISESNEVKITQSRMLFMPFICKRMYTTEDCYHKPEGRKGDKSQTWNPVNIV